MINFIYGIGPEAMVHLDSIFDGGGEESLGITIFQDFKSVLEPKGGGALRE